MIQGDYVLWLTSWYPCATNPYNGDFIQRQAEALSRKIPVVVMHVEIVDGTEQLPEPEKGGSGSLEERIFYTRKQEGSLLGKWKTHRDYLRLFKAELKQLFAEKGFPLMVHVHIPVKAGNLGWWLKRRYGLPFWVSEHYGIYNRLAPDNWFRRSLFFRWQTRQILKAAEKPVVVSKALGRQMNDCVGKMDFVVLPNVVNTNVFHSATAVQSDVVRFLHASTMNEPKNAEGLLRAFDKAWKQKPSIRLTMAGLASPALTAFARSLPSAEAINFPGMIPQATLAGLMQESDAFVLFSNYENLPCVLLEAKCSGLPFISTSVGGIPEIAGAEDKLIAQGDEEALTGAFLAHLLSKAKREKMALEAAEKYSYEAVGTMLFGLYGFGQNEMPRLK